MTELPKKVQLMSPTQFLLYHEPSSQGNATLLAIDYWLLAIGCWLFVVVTQPHPVPCVVLCVVVPGQVREQHCLRAGHPSLAHHRDRHCGRIYQGNPSHPCPYPPLFLPAFDCCCCCCIVCVARTNAQLMIQTPPRIVCVYVCVCYDGVCVL